jgi:hypothetical protein
LAVCELVLAVIFNDVAHLSGLMLVYTRPGPKHFQAVRVNRYRRDPLAASPNPQ